MFGGCLRSRCLAALRKVGCPLDCRSLDLTGGGVWDCGARLDVTGWLGKTVKAAVPTWHFRSSDYTNSLRGRWWRTLVRGPSTPHLLRFAKADAPLRMTILTWALRPPSPHHRHNGKERAGCVAGSFRRVFGIQNPL